MKRLKTEFYTPAQLRLPLGPVSLGRMDNHNDFDSVSWPRDQQHEPAQSPAVEPNLSETSLPSPPINPRRSMSGHNERQAGEDADGVDLAGLGDNGFIECTVETPQKENDGTKDAYVSYLITTNVGRFQRRDVSDGCRLTLV